MSFPHGPEFPLGTITPARRSRGHPRPSCLLPTEREGREGVRGRLNWVLGRPGGFVCRGWAAPPCSTALSRAGLGRSGPTAPSSSTPARPYLRWDPQQLGLLGFCAICFP